MREYFMKSERIGFSKWTMDDFSLAYSVWGDETVTRYICSTGKFTDDNIRDRLKLEVENQKEFNVQYWPIFYLENNEFIGVCGLRPFKDEDNAYEIGFHLKSEYWGKGIAKESAKTVIAYANGALNAKKIFAGHHPENKDSKRVLEKIGFSYIGDNYYDPTGLYHPSYKMDIKKEK